MTSQQLPFLALSALTLVPALMVVRARNIVHAGYWLCDITGADVNGTEIVVLAGEIRWLRPYSF